MNLNKKEILLLKKALNVENQGGETPYGDYLFGEIFDLPEKDTFQEKKILEQLDGFKSDNDKGSLVHYLKVLQKYKQNFPEVLVPETNYLWRGGKVDLTNNQLTLVDDSFEGIKCKSSEYIYIAHEQLQSWTTDKQTALDFMEQGSATTSLTYVIYEAHIPENELIFSTEFFSELSSEFNTAEEYEILRISNSPLPCKIYIFSETL